MTQLVVIACVSLALKVEETQVPLLLDLQVEEILYVFEPKTIQRMKILVLSTLQWKMNLVIPLSFLDYTARRLGLKDHICWKFLRRCDCVLLSVISVEKPSFRSRQYERRNHKKWKANKEHSKQRFTGNICRYTV